jgi:YVTN family beta-propeller protein
MALRMSGLFAIAASVLTGLLGSAQSQAQNAYITDEFAATVSVIDTSTNTVTATIAVGSEPEPSNNCAARPVGPRRLRGSCASRLHKLPGGHPDYSARSRTHGRLSLEKTA